MGTDASESERDEVIAWMESTGREDLAVRVKASMVSIDGTGNDNNELTGTAVRSGDLTHDLDDAFERFLALEDGGASSR